MWRNGFSKLVILFKISAFGAAVYLMYVMFYKNQGDNYFNSQITKIIFDIKNNSDRIIKNEIYVLPLSIEILEIHRRLNLTNPGHLGAPVNLPKNIPEDIQVLMNKSNEYFQFNEFVSQLIPFDRELKDFREDACRAANYSNDLPKVSVILAFYNEPFSMLMRTIYSVLKRSPPELIEEILLVDDFSDRGWLL